MSFAVLGIDPLFVGGVDFEVVLIVIAKTVVVFALLLVSVMLYLWFMRKVIADMQNRIGPSKAGPFGILQSFADGMKLFFKEHTIPRTADRPVFLLAPFVSGLAAFLAFAIVPFGGTVRIGDHVTHLQLADPPVGVLWLLAMSGIGVYGVMLAGWSSGSKYPLLGAVRASAQVLSYEAALGLAIVGVLVHSGTLSTRGIVLGQGVDQGATSFAQIVDGWYWLPAIGALAIFVIAAIAETNHPPFDFVEAEEELAGGYHVEYAGIRFAIFYLAEFMNLITMSAIAVTLFFGGPSGPGLGFVAADSWLNVWVMPVFWFMLKLWILLYATVWLRASLPRLRYDRLMNLSWKVLIEAAFLWAMATGVIVVVSDEDQGVWEKLGYSAAAAVGALAVYLVLLACVPRPGETVEEIK